MIIVTLTKNSEKTIQDTIDSIERQTLKKITYYIFDDNSNDGTLDLIKKSKLKFKIFNIRSKNIFQAYNHALGQLKKDNVNDKIFFLHSDDLLYSNDILEKVNFFFDNHDVEFLFGNIIYFKKNKNKFLRIWRDLPFKLGKRKISDNFYELNKINKKELYFGWSLPHTGIIFDSRILQKFPNYCEKYNISSDYGWSLDLLLEQKIKFHLYNSFIIKMRIGGKSTQLVGILYSIYVDFLIILKRFYKSPLDIFLCMNILFFKKIRKIKQFFISYNE